MVVGSFVFDSGCDLRGMRCKYMLYQRERQQQQKTRAKEEPKTVYVCVHYLFQTFAVLQLVASDAIIHLNDENYSPVRPHGQAPEKRIVTKMFGLINRLYSVAYLVDVLHCFVSLNVPAHPCRKENRRHLNYANYSCIHANLLSRN